MTISDLLHEQARLRPDALALVDERAGQEWCFASLQFAVNAAARWWQAQGLRKGDAVLVFVPMSADLYLALLALFQLGAVAVLVDPSAGPAHLEACCRRWPPKALLAVPKAHLLRLRSREIRKIPLKVVVKGWIPGTRRWPSRLENAAPALGPTLSTNSASPLETVQPEDPALVTFTSGSTGQPKAAVRTQGFLLAQYRALAPNLRLQPGEVDLATLPIFVLANLAAGVTTVLPAVDLRRPGEVDAAQIFAQIERRSVTRIAASPAFFERLGQFGDAHGRTLPSLRHLHTGGAPVFPRLLEALTRLAPQASVVAVYGSTEAEPIAQIDRADFSATDHAAMSAGRGLLAGVPVPQLQLAILADQFGHPRKPESARSFHQGRLAPGTVGEIVVTGEHVLSGYLGGQGDAETKFSVDGTIWHRTGDAGWLDEHGRLWLLGRCSARIEDAQGTLYPFGVECVALTFTEVRRAACVSHRGRRVLIVAAQAQAALQSRLLAATAWARIERVLFVDALPVDRRHNAKIDYPALKTWLESQGP